MARVLFIVFIEASLTITHEQHSRRATGALKRKSGHWSAGCVTALGCASASSALLMLAASAGLCGLSAYLIKKPAQPRLFGPATDNTGSHGSWYTRVATINLARSAFQQ
ncbi:hypothetical protein FN846DRAFT_888355 [Sphaerosporella brunnea]|uniref:Uncharacterized protein n=1 Tax=Sphaerosporella brunnea TaxID=1250544 RepID=A0A5J5F2R1_9PEZI|nr:hypothetical protein FN846DRAFT_888355 [Sphaerosporella brunnea]